MNEAFDRVCKVLSYQEEVVLKAIAPRLSGEVTLHASSIADNTAVARGNLTGIAKRMEEKGLIERVRSKADELVVSIFVTTAGRELYDRIRTATV